MKKNRIKKTNLVMYKLIIDDLTQWLIIDDKHSSSSFETFSEYIIQNGFF